MLSHPSLAPPLVRHTTSLGRDIHACHGRGPGRERNEENRRSWSSVGRVRVSDILLGSGFYRLLTYSAFGMTKTKYAVPETALKEGLLTFYLGQVLRHDE